ncbi:alpha-tubulin N-acetyltransferase 1-like [Adelges cooleyi]|uniref:alpha-tubulin N-acetyltransferase 1-like n=1 Tax=Adelges cooleyi TaxID=133065 RepID=UPI00217F9D2B|nr:alpha-tubulin N-acetyltransferase 1-like [Adelges cooleyi]XP_050441425.1 alpha-tubulin N-acetyltransferase 1-like [Adelges cooleyi]
MEFDFPINDVVTEEVLKIDHTLTVIGHEENAQLQKTVGLIIDGMGNASAIAQELKSPITSAEKLVNSDHVIYVMTEHPEEGRFAVVGILKMGLKKLYLYDKEGSRSEEMVYCLLDFYIHETRQRKGYGKRLFEYMLMDTDMEAKHLAIDKPTKKLLQFMWKHYSLSKLVNQGNNFVIFEEFFNDSVAERKKNSHNRATSYKRQPMFGRHGAHKHHDSMGEIVQGDGNVASMKYKYCENPDIVDNQFCEVNPHPETPSGFKVNRDGESVKRDLKFHHDTLW